MVEMATFTVGQCLSLPELAQNQGLDSATFRVLAVFPGGMGVCLKIQNDTSQDLYAMKVMQGAMVEDSTAWERFVEELKVWLTLSPCDGIVEALCITRVNELPSICAQWMAGGSLRPFMSQRDPQCFYASVYRLVRTLEWAYTHHGIIHRDLKPDNILLDEVRQVYVSDWGLARPLATQSAQVDPSMLRQNRTLRPELTQTGQFLGTIFYASPEQILGSKGVDHRSDIYSLGCILYEWETGHPPFVG